MNVGEMYTKERILMTRMVQSKPVGDRPCVGYHTGPRKFAPPPENVSLWAPDAEADGWASTITTTAN
jgi:hypothetical protein